MKKITEIDIISFNFLCKWKSDQHYRLLYVMLLFSLASQWHWALAQTKGKARIRKGKRLVSRKFESVKATSVRFDRSIFFNLRCSLKCSWDKNSNWEFLKVKPLICIKWRRFRMTFTSIRQRLLDFQPCKGFSDPKSFKPLTFRRLKAYAETVYSLTCICSIWKHLKWERARNVQTSSVALTLVKPSN